LGVDKLKGGGTPAAPAAPPAPIESLGAADKELKKIQKTRATALSEFETGLFGQSSSKGRKVASGRGATRTEGAFATPTGFEGMTLDQKVATLDSRARGRSSGQPDFIRAASSGQGSRFGKQLAEIRGADSARESQLTQFISAEMNVLDKERRKAGRGRTGNIHAGKRKADPNLSDASTLDKTSRTLV
jgi:hypothetical protein